MRNITIITGANSGLGFEFARQLALAARGLPEREFWLIARNYAKLEEAARRIREAAARQTREDAARQSPAPDGQTAGGNLPELKLIALDVAGAEGVARFKDLLLRERAAREFSVEMLVNNAGFGTYGPFIDTPLDKELAMVELNCTALTGLCGTCIPFMAQGAHIVNVASLAAFLPLGNFAVYAATKAYALSFSVALAAELKDKGIGVTALCPGSVSTNFANVASNGARTEVLHGKDPAKVVSHCLKCVHAHKKIALWSPKWKLTALLSRIVSRYAGARYTYLYNKRPYKQE